MSPALRFRAAAVLAAALILAGCSQGTPTFIAAPSPAPTPFVAAVPAAGGTIALPAAPNGETASLVVAPGATSGTTITASVSTTPPANAIAPSARRAEAISGATPFLFITFTVSQSVSLSLLASETVNLLSSFPAQAAYYAEFDDITAKPGTKIACAGPATVSQLVATIANSVGYGVCTNAASSVAPSFLPGHSYLLQFYYVSSASPSPSPTTAPTSSPTSSPAPGAIVVTPSSLYFTGSTPAPQTFTASQSGFTGTFTTTDTCSGYAAVSGSSPTFTVTALAAPSSASTAPTCTVTVSNGLGGTAVVNVFVSTVGVVVNSHGGHQ